VGPVLQLWYLVLTVGRKFRGPHHAPVCVATPAVSCHTTLTWIMQSDIVRFELLHVFTVTCAVRKLGSTIAFHRRQHRTTTRAVCRVPRVACCVVSCCVVASLSAHQPSQSTVLRFVPVTQVSLDSIPAPVMLFIFRPHAHHLHLCCSIPSPPPPSIQHPAHSTQHTAHSTLALHPAPTAHTQG